MDNELPVKMKAALALNSLLIYSEVNILKLLYSLKGKIIAFTWIRINIINIH